MQFIVDKITEGIARLETEKNEFIEVSCILLPSEVKEGDVLVASDTKGTSMRIDEEATLERKARMEKFLEELWED